MPATWRIESWPRCIAYVFLSHCAEERQNLVVPVYKELERRRIAAWIDRHHYPLARDPIEALQEEILRARHVVYFITPSLLEQGRGWTVVERAFSATIQQRLRYDGPEISHVELPLLFVPQDNPIFLRSVWRPLSDKAERCRCDSPDLKTSWRQEHVAWAADTIESFVRQEEQWAFQLAECFDQDSRWARYFNEQNLRERVLAQSPPPLMNS
jgi:hypothetical protein